MIFIFTNKFLICQPNLCKYFNYFPINFFFKAIIKSTE